MKKKLKVSVIYLFLLLFHCGVYAQKPICNFNDEDGYFYHWNFDAENLIFDFNLQNLTSGDITKDITNYKIQWGDGNVRAISTNSDFPLQHSYSEGQYDLTITITYKGSTYDYIYKIYNKKPNVSVDIIEGDNGCTGQEFIFKLKEYENNPPLTRYTWIFGDGVGNVSWTLDDIISENGQISHIYNKTSCDFEDDVEHFAAGATPVIAIGNKQLIGVGTKVSPIIISKNIFIDLKLMINNQEKDFTVPQTGCVEKTIFRFINESDYGLNNYFCEKTNSHKWIVSRINDNGTISETTEGIDFLFVRGSVDSKGDVEIKFLKTGVYKLAFRLSNSCNDLIEETNEISIYQNENSTTYEPKLFCLEDFAIVAFSTSEVPEIEAIQETIYDWTVEDATENIHYNFAESTNRNSQNPKFTFNTAGKFKVKLNKTSLCQTSLYEYWVEVPDRPVVSINKPEEIKNGGYCGEFTFTPTAAYIDNGKNSFGIESNVIDSYEWIFDNNGVVTTSNKETPDPVTFSKPGLSSIKLRTHNTICGWSDFSILEFEIFEIPSSDFVSDEVTCMDKETGYVAISNNMDSYSWRFEDGSIKDGQSVTHFYNTDGGYTTSLTVTSLQGCSSTTSKMIQVKKKVELLTGNDIYLCDSDTEFSISDVTAENYTSVLWTSDGDGFFNDASLLNPTYTLGTTDKTKSEITLRIKLTGNAPCGEINNSKIIHLVPNPIINSTVNSVDVCENTSFQIEGVSIINAKLIEWSADLGGSFSSKTIENPIFTPPSDFYGKIKLNIIAYGNGSCTEDTKTIEVNVIEFPELNAGNDTIICESETINLNAASTSSSNVWRSTGNGVFTDPTKLKTDYIPGSQDILNGQVTFVLEATGSSPCEKNSSMQAVIVRKPVVNAGNDTLICTTQATFNIPTGKSSDKAYAKYYQELEWSTSGTGTFTNSKQLDASYFPSESDYSNGEVILTLKAFSLNPCTVVATDSFKLTFTEVPIASAGSDQTLCQNSPVSLSGYAENHSSILWSTSGNGRFENSGLLNTTYYPGLNEIGNTTISLTVESIGTCDSSKDNVQITFIGNPVANAGEDAEICENSSYILSEGDKGANVVATTSVFWESSGDGSFDNNKTLNASYTPGINDKLNGRVTLKLTANPITPCLLPDTDEMDLIITPMPVVNAGNDVAICQGDDYQMASSSAENYSYVEWSSSSSNGYFENKNSLQATYHPGAEDKGTYILTLAAYGNGSCVAVTDQMTLNITPAPIVRLIDNDRICADNNYLITDAIAQNTPSYSWSTTGKGILTEMNTLNPTYVPQDGETGDIFIRLTVQGNGRCGAKTAETKLTIVPHPSVSAGLDGEVCANSIYSMNVGNNDEQINAQSYSSIDYNTLGDGFFTDKDNLYAKYVPGPKDIENRTVEIIITANSILPCAETDRDTMKLTITPAPEINAGFDDRICQGDVYKLDNSSEYETSGLNWSSANGGSFDNIATLHPYYTPEPDKTGVVTLQLTATGNGSCSEINDQMQLNIVALPKVNAGNDAVVCFNKNFELTNAIATSFSSVKWATTGTGTFSDDSALKPTYLPSQEDYLSEKVNLIVTVQGLSPCLAEDTDTLNLNFIESPYVFAGKDDEICEEVGSYTLQPKTVDYPNGSEVKNVSAFYWETDGNGSLQNNNTLQPTYIFAPNETGIITLTLKASGYSNCDRIEDTMELTIVPTPNTDFSYGTSCINNEVVFTDKSNGGIFSIKEWQWDFGEGSTSEIQNPKHVYTKAEYFTVSLTTTNIKGCTSTNRKTLEVYPLPVVTFTHDKIASVNVPLVFINESFDTETYLWEFGDGSVSTEKDPYHTYTKTGVFTVNLSAESKKLCTNNFNSEVEIIGKPEASFTQTKNGCGPLTVEFTNTSTGKFAHYSWDFGNKQYSNKKDPDPVVFQPGVLGDTTYTVQLTVSNKAGISTHTSKVIVKPLPIPQFEILPKPYGCTPVVRQIFNHSKGLPTNYMFDFRDGAQYSYQAPSVERPFDHEFRTGEIKTIYPVTLTATNECGSRSVTKNMTVYPNTAVAVIKTKETEGCAPFTVEFQNLSTGSGDQLESDWSFEDGKASIRNFNTETVYHTFETAGTYNVLLTVNDTCATDNTTILITVYDSKDIDFTTTVRKFCALEQIKCEVDPSIENIFTNYIWDLGDGSEKIGKKIVHTYKESGTYTIRLSGISIENGCEKTVAKEIQIADKPEAKFTFNLEKGCEPLNISFVNESTGSDFYVWDFNNGATSNKKAPSYTFSNGNYTVSLISESADGCLDTLFKEITVYPKPEAKFICTEKACTIPYLLEIKNTSKNKTENSYLWDFGNGSYSNKINPTEENYNDYGAYKIQLTAENQFGCTDDYIQDFTVYRTPIIKYEQKNTIICENDLVEFTDQSLYRLYSYWQFGDNYKTQGQNVSHIFQNFGKYDFKLKVVGEGGCADSIVEKNKILIYPKPITDFSWENVNIPPEDIQLPEGIDLPNNGKVKFINLTREITDSWISNKGYTYKWDFDDFITSDEYSPIHRYENNGTFEVKLVATSAYSCQDATTQFVEVDLMSSLYVPNAFNPDNPNPQVAKFLPKGIGLFKYHIEILDRWGNILWVSDKIKDGSPAEGWDGTYEGKIQPQGVYIWRVRAVFTNGTTWKGILINGKYHREGSVTLIR